MNAKFDKDLLIKHKFWVLLGVSVPLIIAAFFILSTSVSADIEAKRKNNAEKEKQVSKTSGVIGPGVNDPLRKVAEDRKVSETDVHAIAFKAQEPLSTWPTAIEDTFDFAHGWFATEVKVLPAPQNKQDKSTWPANEDGLFHGFVKEIDENSAEVEGYEKIKGKEKDDFRDKTAKFYRTAKLKVTFQEKKEGQKEHYGTIPVGAFLAISYYKSKYFYDPLTEAETTVFVKSYSSQLDGVLRMVDPVDAKGNGTVQFQGWTYSPGALPNSSMKFFTYVPKWKAEGFISEEAWLAQEDLWIQRELFRIIRSANDIIGKCKFGEDKDKNPIYVNPQAEDKSKPAVCFNPYFDLKFEWDGPKLFVTVKNLIPRRQKLDIYFNVRFNKSANASLSTERITVGGEPLEPFGQKNDARRFQVSLMEGGIQRNGVYEVEQVLNWETAAVKRIDQIAIGWPAGEIAHSHKTYPEGSKPYRKEEKKEEAKKDVGPMGAQPMGPEAQMALGGKGAFGAGFGAGANAAEVGLNGVLKERYLEVSEQSRRVPIGLALIVDQDHVDRVLTAFNNSKLRFLTTQVLLNHYHGSVRPQVAGAAAAPKEGDGDMPATAPIPAAGGGPRGGGFGSGAMMPKGLNLPGSAAGFGPASAPTASGAGSGSDIDEMEANMELVIYGIVTLYERYPKRKTETK
jgi:hypothetical protein